MLSGRNIILTSGVSFSDNWTSKQEVARALAGPNRVLYVGGIPSFYRREAGWRAALNEVSKDLFVYVPPPIRVPLDYASCYANEGMQRLVRSNVRRIAGQLDFVDPILWLFDYRTSCYIGSFEEALSIYHCVDKWSLLTTGPHCRRSTILELESRIARKADLVFASSRDLKCHIEDSYGRDAVYLPHGVDFGLFAKAGEDGHIPFDIRAVPTPVVGFVGTVGSWVDCEILLCLAKERPDLSVAVVGPIRSRADEMMLRTAANVHLLGQKPKAMVPDYLRAFDVCLLPFRVDDLTRSVNPLKLLEYLATGKPVVSTALEEVCDLAGLVYVAADQQDFVELVDLALSENDSELAARRVSEARTHTWVHQMRKASRSIEACLASLAR